MTQGNGQVILLNVSEFAKLCGTTPRTIRLYEKRGLIRPFKIDHGNSYRFYHQDQVRDVLKIKLLQQFELTLNEIKKILRKKMVYPILNDKVSFIKQEIEQKKNQLNFLESINSLLFDSEAFESHIKKSNFGPYTLFCMDIKVGNYDKLTDYVVILERKAQELGIIYLDTEITFYHDPKYKPKNSHLEVALVCTKIPTLQKSLEYPFSIKKYPKQKVLQFDFTGSYNYLALIYRKIDSYIAKNNIKIAKSITEMYLKHSLHTNNPNEYITRIIYPI